MPTETNRRPLKTRQQQWVKALTQKLVATNMTPNQISLVSIVCGALAGAAFYAFSGAHNGWWLLLAAVFIQLRLLCNLLDGLVAVEGGKGTASGELFNDIPDRIADVFIFVGAGYAVSSFSVGVTLGWTAAVLSVLTAYVRVLGTALGAPTSFAGPMAKQHRMAVLTAACVFTALESWLFGSFYMLLSALVIVALGALLTCFRRAAAIYHCLENRAD